MLRGGPDTVSLLRTHARRTQRLYSLDGAPLFGISVFGALVLQVADVKTGSSRRTIDLDPRTVAVLRSWRKRQLEERLALGGQHEDHGLVFARPEGSPIHPDLFSKTFDRMVAAQVSPSYASTTSGTATPASC